MDLFFRTRTQLQKAGILTLVLVIGLVLSYTSGDKIGIIPIDTTSLGWFLNVVQSAYISVFVLSLAWGIGFVQFVWPPKK